MNNPTATWDAGSGLTLVVGDTGVAAGVELWGWDGSSWLQLDDGKGVAPFARDDAHLIADTAHGAVWLHGGRTQAGGGAVAHSDTWRWDGSAWTEIVPDGASTSPPARVHPAVGWDAESAEVILYGGIGVEDSSFTDTWSWDGTAWSQRQVESPGIGQAPVGMAWDGATDEVALMTVDLSAEPADGLYPGRIWTLTDARWLPRDGNGPSFSPIQPMVGTTDGLILVDGGLLQDSSATWTWDGSRWTVATVSGPSPRNGHALAFDAARGRVVLFGGFDGSHDVADLWEWDGTAWEQLGGG